jgi:hypothetical protein
MIMPKGVYVRTEEMKRNLGRYERTSDIRQRCRDVKLSLFKNIPEIGKRISDFKKKMYQEHPEKRLIGKRNGMFGKKQNILSVLESVIVKTGRDGRPKGSGLGYKVPENVKLRIHRTRMERIKSGKIVYPKGEQHPMFGKHQTEDTKQKIRIANTGRRFSKAVNKKKGLQGKLNPFYGKRHSDKTKLLIGQKSAERIKVNGHPWFGRHHSSVAKQKISNANIGRKHSDVVLQKLLKMRLQRPTKFELAVQQFLEMHYPGEWKYCGDGSVILNGKCPDFINCNGQKKVVLANSVYWHMTVKGLTRKQSERIELKPYNEIGFDVWFIWDDKLKGLL